MFLQFPEKFFWGTSTAAYQIETAGEHTWKGFKSVDGSIFDKCSMHDLRRDEDLEYICKLAPSYRMSMDWSKLQKEPFGDFDAKVVAEYKDFLDKLKARNETIMLVLHHFTNPLWFEKEGGWETDKSIELFLDYVKKFVDTFGSYADLWNTFNEPMVYISNGWLTGAFPPHKKGKLLTARKILKRISAAHDQAYDIIKAKSSAPVGISKNTVKFAGEVFPGQILAWIFDRWFNIYGGDHFKKVDFQGLSYYARMPFRPLPIDMINTPGVLEKLGRRHDMMWEYKPEEFYHIIHRFWKRYKKPIIITESGICTHDPKVRIESIKEYLYWIHKAMEEGVPILGYYHWSTIDNHEWNIGLNYRFGLVNVDFETGNRTMTEAGDFYSDVTARNGVEIEKAYC